MKVIVTGASGMVGEGVLHECLAHPAISDVLVLTRKVIPDKHPKLKQLVLDNFMEVGKVESQLAGYDACYFCLGVSSIGMKEEQYTKLTYDLTMTVAKVLKKQNPEMAFCYVSGSSTDSTEKGRSMWARVKGRTENELRKLFNRAFMFRPGYMHPTKGLKNTLKYYKYFSWMYPAMRKAFPSFVSTLSELGLAMIHVSHNGYHKQVLEVKDIVAAAALEKK